MSPTSRVKVSYLGHVRNALGRNEEEVEVARGATVGELLRSLVNIHGDPFRLRIYKGHHELPPTVLVCVNNPDIAKLDGLITRRESGGEISIVVGVYPPKG